MIPLQDKLKNKPQKKCTCVSMVKIKAEYHKITTLMTNNGTLFFSGFNLTIVSAGEEILTKGAAIERMTVISLLT